MDAWRAWPHAHAGRGRDAGIARVRPSKARDGARGLEPDDWISFCGVL